MLRGFPDTVHGTFRLASGRLGFDADSGAAEGCVRVDARSGDSGNASRDRKMHEQILESLRYPEVSLRPTRVAGRLPAEGNGALSLQGWLSLRGTEHPVTLSLRVARSGSTVTAEAPLTIPYVAWGAHRSQRVRVPRQQDRRPHAARRGRHRRRCLGVPVSAVRAVSDAFLQEEPTPTHPRPGTEPRHDTLYAEHVNAQWVRLLDVLGMNVR